ncbi:MAG: hypothetical protein V1772_13205 [Chloroflexota bacterium]
MAVLMAFASLPFELQGGTYQVKTGAGPLEVRVADARFTPFLSITSRPELAQSIPPSGEGQGFTTYTWYDHPFVLRVTFGRNVAALGSINSCATIVRPLPSTLRIEDAAALEAVRGPFAETALEALNALVAVVRHKARLYAIADLRRDDIDLTVRAEDGALLREDPLQADLLRQERAQSETFDLVGQNAAWYQELCHALAQEEPLGLADSLLVEAERALAQRFPRQAIATCHTALEAAASALLTRGMLKRGLPDAEIDHLLSTQSLTSKLEAMLVRYTGFSLKRHNRPLWHAFNQLNDLRNDTVHRGQHPKEEHAAFAIQVTRDVLGWLAMVSQRNR